MSRPVRISVVLVWRDPREGLVEALRTLTGPVEAIGGEVIVVTDLGDSALLPAQEAFPGLGWVRVDPPMTEPLAWEAGARVARGEMVAFAQARCRYDPGWAAAILTARAAGADAVAGPVALGTGAGLPARAAYLCDYGMFADPKGGGGGGLSGNNMAVARLALPASQGRGWPKLTLLARIGRRVAWAPAMRATTYPYRPARAEWNARFHRGRHYASLRSSAWSSGLRLAAGLGCLALPGLLFARLAGCRFLRKHYGRALTLGAPWVGISLGAWSLGELCGYWTGEGSSSRFL